MPLDAIREFRREVSQKHRKIITCVFCVQNQVVCRIRWAKEEKKPIELIEIKEFWDLPNNIEGFMKSLLNDFL